MKITNLLIAASSLLMFNSCKKAASSDQSLGYQLQTINPTAVVNAPTTAGSITWTSGSALATLIKLEAKNSSGAEVEFKSQMAQTIDLFSSVASNLGNVVIPPGNYSEVEFKIQLTPNGNTPALTLNGTYTSGTRLVIPVVFQVNSLLEIKAEQSNVVITANTNTTALTSVNLASLTTGITQAMLAGATVTGGSIVISATSNTNLFAIISSNLTQSHEVELHH